MFVKLASNAWHYSYPESSLSWKRVPDMFVKLASNAWHYSYPEKLWPLSALVSLHWTQTEPAFIMNVDSTHLYCGTTCLLPP